MSTHKQVKKLVATVKDTETRRKTSSTALKMPPVNTPTSETVEVKKTTRSKTSAVKRHVRQYNVPGANMNF